MAISLTLLPQYPIPGTEFTVKFSGLAGNTVRVMWTAAPDGTDQAKDLEKSEKSEVFAHEADPDTPWALKLDKGGVYKLRVYDVTKGAAAYGGGYSDSPDGYATETIEATDDSQSIEVGQALTVNVGAGADRAPLKLYVWGSTIRATTDAQHGEVTPSFDVTSVTDKAKQAAESATVETALAALDGQTVANAIGNLATVINDIRSKYEAHRVQIAAPAVHASSGDTVNSIPLAYISPLTPDSTVDCARELLSKIRAHMLTDLGPDATQSGGTGTGDWHNSSKADWDIPNADTPTDIAGAMMAVAIVHREYEDHLSDLIVHLNADTVNGLATTISTSNYAIMNVYAEFLSVLKTLSPTAPPVQNPGVTQLVNNAGFKEV
ncbi:MAG: hypothetical protein ACYTBJ_25920 [Planctomycetota bacterium]|jgi:hypothetical protein